MTKIYFKKSDGVVDLANASDIHPKDLGSNLGIGKK
jgi:hypothetical protein